MNYKIRQMTIDDINDVIKGESNAFGESLGFDMLYQELTINPSACYFVLEIDNKIRGYIGTWINENAEIVNFYIDKKYQNQGFGKMLLNFLLDLIEMVNEDSFRIKNLSLEVRVSNIKAIRLYEKFGFTKSHIRKNYYKDGEDAIVMIKDFEVNK
ncbi:MAG TPA: ribosomal protein S18-alanine N-acetyltransferase [Acholeplasmataceae bacterium]|nr:ribosomal protein S18-alanine N-acetyltransferase [Acholeplasmataceae bacterium]